MPSKPRYSCPSCEVLGIESECTICHGSGWTREAPQTEEEWNARPRLEARPERVPAPEDLKQIESFFDWIDSTHEGVRGPWGTPWVEIQLRLASMKQFMNWADSQPNISPRYRYRIDAPMDPDAKAPDHLPEGW